MEDLYRQNVLGVLIQFSFRIFCSKDRAIWLQRSTKLLFIEQLALDLLLLRSIRVLLEKHSKIEKSLLF